MALLKTETKKKIRNITFYVAGGIFVVLVVKFIFNVFLQTMY